MIYNNLIFFFKFQSRKFIGPYDYRYNNSRMLENNRQQAPQKKHQMYGKRFAHESVLPPPIHHHPTSNPGTSDAISNVPLKYEPYEPYASAVSQPPSATTGVIKPPATLMESEMKYSYTLDFPHQRHKNTNGISTNELIGHNHTYAMPPHPHPAAQLLNGNGANPKPQTRDKKMKKSEDEHMTRDEKRARAMQIPISVSFFSFISFKFIFQKVKGYIFWLGVVHNNVRMKSHFFTSPSPSVTKFS